MKKEPFIFWTNQSAQYIWLHNENQKIYYYSSKILQIINIIFILGLFLLENRLLGGTIAFFELLITNIYLFKFIKRGIQHKIAKRQYKIFLNEINQELNLCIEDLDFFILYKKLEFDKFNKESPSISQSILNKFNKKFSVISNITKIPRKYNLHDKLILIKSFNIWKTSINNINCNPYSLGPLYRNRNFFLQFQNVKLKNDVIEIKIQT
jgi:hypothetical protein